MVRLLRRGPRAALVASALTAAVVLAVVVSAAALGGGSVRHVGSSSRGGPHSDASTQSLSGLVSLTRQVKCPQPARVVTAEALKAFRAVTAVTCGQDSRQLSRAGEWLVQVRRVAVAGISDLQSAYELPSEPLGAPPPGSPSGTSVGCTLELVVTPPVILVDATGKALAPTAPTTGCGKPLPQVLRAIQAVSWREISVRRLRQVVTPRALAARCDMQWKNENWIATEMSGRRSDGGPVFSQVPSSVHVCIYRVTGRDLEVGSFRRAKDLGATAARTLARALERPGPMGACPTQREFAVVHTPQGGWANVELGGCWRVARSYPMFATGRADPTTVGQLLDR